MSFPSLISQKLGEIPILFRTFFSKLSSLAYIFLKINIFRSAMFYYVIHDFGTNGKMRPYLIPRKTMVNKSRMFDRFK